MQPTVNARQTGSHPAKEVPVEITEVRIKLVDDSSDRLLGFCTITIDREFVVRDLRIIQGQRGPFVAMPSRKLMEKCPSCYMKNEVRSRFCNGCGARLVPGPPKSGATRTRTFADIAHPINSSCRNRIQESVLDAYDVEVVKAKDPDYVCTYDDYDEMLALSRASERASSEDS